MKCPNCGSTDDRVLESRQIAEGSSIRRRRVCNSCEYRFTSYEHIEEKKLMIVKKDNRREEFSRDKLSRGLQKACEKRPVSQPSIDQSVIEIHEKANFMAGDTHEINSIKLGEIVMDKLKELDLVAYIRFASVYKQFDDVKEFIKEIKKINK
ncbi:MAG: transcriptional regulator NrdR [Spirochaetes bacterium GWF1_31_7]|nr:MAG: transcriptional regulator NrdR [Spirochaetes bacterium GWE1_32_154]OHD45180.1 MAG: transcriptional regulator NrdR [Spirochaetes bacterium GWE2_31_10]OHD51089.1 MAG: transcriptional regulator NrdR [Spirochaetes bacterium GWF1_31_7]OHD79614.1 MAG: transcriptional regulator NrdR [Spirochaetes bacterium RIFOXYB1_FULL_32_8]HBD94813.1 transcriptional regulator NrdR [Spirochaetia bacterium]